MKRFFAFALMLMVLVAAWPAAIHAQQKTDDRLYQQIFGKTQEKLNQAKAGQGDVLSPDVFARALKRFGEAQDDFKRGRGLGDIDRKLREVNADLEQVMQTAKVAKAAFTQLLQTRDDALKANAPQYAAEIYTPGDQAFKEAMRKLETGDMNGARKRAEEAERYLRDAELQAIKVSIIGTVRNYIIKAQEVKVDKLAPLTFGKAQALLAEAENILNTNRYAAATAREKAEAAEYEIRHATYLAEQIQRIKVDEREWEKYFLASEKMVANVSKELGFSPQFDAGIAKPLSDIQNAVKTLREEQRRLTEEAGNKDKRIEELNKELSAMREAQTGLESELAKKQQMLLEKQRQEEKLRGVEAMFAPIEAKVIREGENLRIRLVGLTFRSGKATIEPEYFSLLTKLQRAIREFPGALVVIEGHTDAIGNDAYNESLSSERALAVKQYLVANMNLPEDRIQAVGYGESSPIASNDTEEGRAQNRRIDVVIAMQR
ncbi:MAG: OmpA family protein [candidate division KSB1 bacterium]|nr:OmpA family protein [candidate division KSB1 bacterium]MDZ7310920.1 OmpA family protein [candidate division KSB1 bacterium]